MVSVVSASRTWLPFIALRFIGLALLVCGAISRVPNTFAALSPEEAANTVILDEIALKNLSIQTVEVEETQFEESVFALGRIQVFPGKHAVVSPRISGQVSAVLVEPDQRVEKNAELLRVESRQAGDPPPTISLKAPFGGFIAKLDAKVGLPVSPDSTLMEIVDLSSVHAIANVPEHLAHRLKTGARASIRVAGFPDEAFVSTLGHIGAVVDERSGTIEAVFHLENPGNKLRPGMRAEFSIVTDVKEGVLSIPRQALQGDQTNRFVYRKHYDAALKGAFLKVPVHSGAMNDRQVEIKQGLIVGDEVVTTGAYSLIHCLFCWIVN